MARPRTTKDLAQRIDASYYRRGHWLRRTRFLLTMGCLLAGGLYVAAAVMGRREGVFANGPLSSSHALFEQDCARCHVERFGPVHDGACMDCHMVGPHLPVGQPGEPSCASCHREHKGRDPLTRVADGHCNQCHEDHARIDSLRVHLDFRVRDYDQFLRFPHDRHLAPELVEGPLNCASCHVPERSGFRRIDFAEHCARCHTERIEPDIPEESVPHGIQPKEMRDWIRAVFLRRFQEDPTLVTDDPRTPRNTPAWTEAIETRTSAAMDALLQEGRGCMLCHIADGGAGERIRPPRIPSRWLGEARFEHKTHRFESCDRCHNMSVNRKAEDLTLPGIATCRECHREGGARTTCVTCHPYHPVGGVNPWR